MLTIAFTLPLQAQQIADTTYNPSIPNPMYNQGKGPVVFIDEGHNNFHTKEGRYKAFSNLLERDGYDVKGYKGSFEPSQLAKGKILVISNAINKQNVGHWYVPIHSAFTEQEIDVVKNWVAGGGSLFLIADHMPMAGAAKTLAAAFEFKFTDGFVFHNSKNGPALFKKDDGSLTESIITKGRNDTETVKQIATFTGQGFEIPKDAQPILVFDENYVNKLPDTAWVFTKDTKTINMKGWSQGAYKAHGKGKIVVFGEAAMFTAQLAGKKKVKAGMNRKVAAENYQLLLNIIHWLDGKLD